MRSIVIALVGLLCLVIAVLLYSKRRGRGWPANVGFREYVRNPKLRSRVADAFAHRDATAARLAKRPPEDLVPLLLDDAEHHVAKRAIIASGPAVVPVLISALSKPEFRRKSQAAKQEGMHLLLRRSQPVVTVLECLEHYAPPEAVSAIAPLVLDHDDEVRKQAALALGAIASDDAAAPLSRSLSDENDYVRSYALMGIRRALDSGRATGRFSAGIYDAVEALVFRRDRTVSGDAPRCLLRLDRERAIATLTDPRRYVEGCEGLHDVLRALREGGVPVPETQLLSLLSALESKVETYPNDYVVGEALHLLAHGRFPSAVPAIERGLASPSKRVREAAAEALVALRGLEDPFRTAFARLEEVGWNGLSEAVSRALAVRVLIDEVENGGLAQYFVNSSGNQWRQAEAGLTAVGASADVSVLRDALGMFGPEGPSTNTERRHRQLADVVRGNDDVFSPLDKRFYEDGSDREVLLMRYIAANASSFSKRPR